MNYKKIIIPLFFLPAMTFSDVILKQQHCSQLKIALKNIKRSSSMQR
jgi:hypothetical protein